MKWKIEFGSCPLEKAFAGTFGNSTSTKKLGNMSLESSRKKDMILFLIQWHANPQMWNRGFSWSHNEALLCLGHSDDLQRLGHCGISIRGGEKLNRQIFITDRNNHKKIGWTLNRMHIGVVIIWWAWKLPPKRCETHPRFCKSMFMHLTKLSRIFAQLWGDRQSQWGHSGAVTFTFTKMICYIILLLYIYILYLCFKFIYYINDFIICYIVYIIFQ